MAKLTGIGALALTLIAAAPAWADLDRDMEICPGGPGVQADAQLRACTAIIEDGTQPQDILAIAYYNRGNAQDELGKLDQAIQDYSESIRLNPNDADAYSNRGLVYFRKRQFDDAIRDGDAAIRLTPGNAVAFNNRGGAYNGKRQWDRAIQDFDQAIRLKPGYANAYNNRGYSKLAKGLREAAIADFREALKLQPGHELARKGLQKAGAAVAP